MPFEQITTIRHSGEAKPEDKFLIHTTAGDYIGGAEYTEYPSAALCLHREHWPPEVTLAAETLCRRYHRRGIDTEMKDVTAWIRRPWQMVEGVELLPIQLRWGRGNLVEVVILEGTIISLTPT